MKSRKALKIALLVILLLLLIFAAVLLVRTLTYPFDHGQQNDIEGDMAVFPVTEQSLDRFAGGIRIPTVGAAEYTEVDLAPFDRFKQYLADSYPRIYETMDFTVINGYGLVFHWHGSGGAGKPILFLSHYDVVPADVEGDQDGIETVGENVFFPDDDRREHPGEYFDRWEYPAFSGAVAGGNIYGRGTLDMKCMLFAVMEAADALIGEGFVPRQDIWFAFGQDEENGGLHGAVEIAKYFREQGLRFDAVYDEGGIIGAPGIGGVNRPLALVGVAEKGFYTMTIKVKGVGGHSSMPPVRSTLVEAAEIITKLNDNQMPLELIPPIEGFLDNVGGAMPLASRLAIANRWLMKGLLLKKLSSDASTNALVRTTTAVTMAKGSDAANVIAPEAEVTVNFRILPGNTVADVLAHVERICSGYDVEITTVNTREPSGMSPTDVRGFSIIEEIVGEIYPDAIVTSYVTVGGTDAYKYQIVSDNVYRFLPIYLNQYEQQTIHNRNEHISIDNFGRMIEYYRRIMTRFWE
ncbi:MAG: M20/M25/M40 family metallo-hydrolase [Rikenellaceae bacterium]|nr:M20/M25/M40 family metallo-hydrolase [Rikenellaceae bacterium]